MKNIDKAIVVYFTKEELDYWSQKNQHKRWEKLFDDNLKKQSERYE